MANHTTFKSRLEKLMSDYNLNANSFSVMLGYDKPEKIYRLLRDDKNRPSVEILQDISNKFEKVNLIWLLNGKGEPYLKKPTTPIDNVDKATSPAKKITETKKGETFYKINVDNPMPILAEPEAVYERTITNMPRILTVNERGIDNILYVPVKAQAGYLLGYGDPEYIETLPTFHMPGLTNSSFRMFEIEGLSMSPTLSDRDKVIGEWVPSVDHIRENRVHIMVLRDGVVVKRVLNRVKERGKLYLKSDTLTHRQDYPIREIEPADILEIWYVRLKVSGDLSEPAEIYNRVADLEINMLEVLKLVGKGK